MANKSKSSKKPTLKSQIESLQNEIKEEKDKFLRLFAEFENYKKRTSKERLDLYKTASQELMTALLPIIDDLKRASAEFEKSKEAIQNAEAIFTGGGNTFELVNQLYKNDL